MNWDQYKHEVLTAVAGFLGSLALIGNTASNNFRTSAVIAFTGVTVAAFFTPVVSHMPYVAELGMKTGNRSDYAIAFFLGTSGWMFIAWFQKKFYKKENNESDENTSDN